eukprot:TRINITY_DN5447_c0_g1_i1.p1 TRINITY_DN5447_c0_g1~~TRINITY_DN5447_c0_g1_i1.p1  ORF type:complete len:1092 (-),score=307.20 TRINITY_DN5447_c0_g1_i1:64-3339(-)
MSGRTRNKRVFVETEENDSHTTNENGGDEVVDETQPSQIAQTPSSSTTKRVRNGVRQDNGHEDEYKPGSIVRVKLHNFVTYDHCEFRPGPQLNVVVGPNGSGKSSIVCALALGLAGHTNLLGRAKEVSDFIKHGADRGYIEIELKGNGNSPNLVIRRDIKKDGSSDWRLNGRSSTKNDVLKRAQDLNVQVDNLCQFLPQDKVSSFAAMDPPELLQETEQALGADQLISLHKQLIEMKKSEKELNLRLTDQTSILDNLKKQNQALERDVLRFKEREKHLQRKELLEKKKPWLLFEESRVKALELKELKTAALEELRKSQQALEPLKARAKDVEVEVAKLDRAKKSVTDNVAKLETTKKAKNEEFDKFTNKYDQCESDLQRLKESAKDKDRKIAKENSEIEKLEGELSAIQPLKDIDNQINSLNERIRNGNRGQAEIQAKRIELTEQRERVVAELREYAMKLKSMEDIKERRWGVIRNQVAQNVNGKDCWQAFLWLEANRKMFKGRILGPVAIEINCSNPQHAIYIEMALPSWLLFAFVCEYQEDRDLFLKELVDRKKLKINSTFLPQPVPLRREYNIDDYKKYGMENWMDETFTAPDLIKQALYENAAINTIAIFGNEAMKHMQSIHDSPLKAYYTPESRYTKTRSKYGDRNVSTVSIPLRPGRFLSAGVDEEQKRKIKEAETLLKQKLYDYDQELAKHSEVESQANKDLMEIKKQKDNLGIEKKKFDTLQKRIEAKRKMIQELERTDDTTEDEEKIKSEMESILKRRGKIAVEVLKTMKQYVEQQLSSDMIILQRAEALANYSTIKDEIATETMKTESQQKEAERISKQFDQVRDQARQRRETAEKAAPLTNELKLEFEKLPNTLPELEDAIEEATASANSIFQTNPQVIIDYEKRQEEIAELQEKVNSGESNKNDLSTKITRTREKWEPPLEKLIQRIKASFSKFFSEIGCVGDVVLNKQEDFAQWGLELRVKFRDTDNLSTLTAHLQSGGERSVATMLFLIALQDLTPVPFRVVDEINQGMDPHNERMIFSQVVNCATKPGLPQYFLITPKLLPDLTWTERMTVLCVFNGPWMLEQEKWEQSVKDITDY